MFARTLAMMCVMTVGYLSAAEPNEFPYDDFTKFSEQMQGETLDGVLMIGAFLKAAADGDRLDAAKANFRIRMPDGSTVAMRCDVLPEKVEDAKVPADQKRIQMGFTHKLWIPKDPEKYKGAVMLNDLAPGSLKIEFPLPPREAAAP